MPLKPALQSIEECAAIKEKVKRYIAEQNAREGAAGSSSGEMAASSTPVIETLADDGTGAPTEDAAQDGVDNLDLFVIFETLHLCGCWL